MSNVQRLSRERVEENTSKKEAFIYALLCPHTDQIKYIGKTSKLNIRMSHHINDAIAKDPRKYNSKVQQWIRKLFLKGTFFKFKVIRKYPVHLIDRAEAYWINFYLASGYDLLNMMKPGFKNFTYLYRLNYTMTKESREKRSKAMRRVKSYKLKGIKKDGTEYKFDCLTDAANTFGIPHGNICKVLSGHRNTAGGLK